MGGFYVPGGRTDGDLVELTICVLEGQGHVELEDEADVEALVQELAGVLTRHRDCILVPGDPYARDAEQLAHCWMADRYWHWQINEAPRFDCPCGVLYGQENSGYGRGWVFYALDGDGAFDGDPVAECPCGRTLGDVHEKRREAASTGQSLLFE